MFLRYELLKLIKFAVTDSKYKFAVTNSKYIAN